MEEELHKQLWLNTIKRKYILYNKNLNNLLNESFEGPVKKNVDSYLIYFYQKKIIGLKIFFDKKKSLWNFLL